MGDWTPEEAKAEIARRQAAGSWKGAGPQAPASPPADQEPAGAADRIVAALDPVENAKNLVALVRGKQLSNRGIVGAQADRMNQSDAQPSVDRARAFFNNYSYGIAPKLADKAVPGTQDVYTKAVADNPGAALAGTYFAPFPKGTKGVPALTAKAVLARAVAGGASGAAIGGASAYGANQPVGPGMATGAVVGAGSSLGADALSKAIGSPMVRNWAARLVGGGVGGYLGAQAGGATGSTKGAVIGGTLGTTGGASLAKKLMNNPEMLIKISSLQRWLPTLSAAAQKGDAYLTAHLHAISQRDPSVRQELREAMEAEPRPSSVIPTADYPTGGGQGY